ncbi:hypothetical protein JCM10449v2_000407 [Rhodotorula kratochvilovae]
MAYSPPASTIPLVHLYTPTGAPTPGLDGKDSYLCNAFPDPPSSAHKSSDDFSGSGETVVPRARRRRLPSFQWSWGLAETVLWATLPPVLFVAGLALLTAAMFGNAPRYAYLSVVEQGGTGRLDYYIFQSCAVAAGSTTRTCTPLSTAVDFLPSLTTISPSLLGFSALQLPFHSRQTPAIFLSSLLFLAVALLLYAPLWTLSYFPHAPLPRLLVRLCRYSAANLFAASGLFAFLSFLFTLTIGIGTLLQAQAAAADFSAAYRYGAVSAAAFAEIARPSWVPELGRGFDLVWAASGLSAGAMLAVKISLHNGLDERVEWPEEKR